jgi:mRNA-degrading endonuclease RelE of RelBE toxin-antitoxin system
MYEVLVKKKVLKDIGKLPEAIQKALVNLIDDLREKGPSGMNGRILGNRNIRLSLPSVKKWVVCWHCEKKL